MKTITAFAAALLFSEGYCGFLPETKKLAAVPAGIDYTDQEILDY